MTPLAFVLRAATICCGSDASVVVRHCSRGVRAESWANLRGDVWVAAAAADEAVAIERLAAAARSRAWHAARLWEHGDAGERALAVELTALLGQEEVAA